MSFVTKFDLCNRWPVLLLYKSWSGFSLSYTRLEISHEPELIYIAIQAPATAMNEHYQEEL